MSIPQQTFSNEMILPHLVEWFNSLPSDERIINPSEFPLFKVKVAHSETSGIVYLIGNQTVPEENYIGEAVYTWIGKKGFPVVAGNHLFFEISKFIKRPETSAPEFRVTDLYIQWNNGDGVWIDLIPLASLKGDKGDRGDDGEPGKSAYQLALEDGFEGTLQEWLISLQGLTAYQDAVKNHGFEGTFDEWARAMAAPPINLDDANKWLTNDGTNPVWKALEIDNIPIKEYIEQETNVVLDEYVPKADLQANVVQIVNNMTLDEGEL